MRSAPEALLQMEDPHATEVQQARAYVVDSRPLCQGMPFVLSDSAHPRIVLKQASHFLILDREGYIPACNALGYGYYHNDTRYLSQWEITLDGSPLSLLSFDTAKGYTGSFLYTNPQTASVSQQKLMVERQIVLSDVLCEKLIVENYSSHTVQVQLCIQFQSDFADMFEVRGLNRPTRGRRMLPASDQENKRLFLAYKGLDNCLLETLIQFQEFTPDTITDGRVTFNLTLPPRIPCRMQFYIYTTCDGMPRIEEKEEFSILLQQADIEYTQWLSRGAKIYTEHDTVNFAIERGLRDIYILRQSTPKGVGIAAGIPWYCAVFGRDSAITGWQLLPFRPDISRECIELLAAYQGSSTNKFRAERNGKIMHELRLGELANLGVIPHAPYYGSVDATALWLMLLARYIKWTGDLSFAERLWTNAKQALNWLDKASEGGYLTYKRESAQGLENQGWKDSGDAICHADGTLAIPPIALCEAQGYLYAARLAGAEIADLLGHHDLSSKLKVQATKLKDNFERDFWLQEENFPALAIDGTGRQVRVVSSNAGHCLWSGILDGTKAHRVAERLLEQDIDCGWGLRTLSSQAAYYNPMSYHNGSVWPHDNAIIIEGLRRIGRIRDAHHLLAAMLSIAQHQDDFRLPELVCGFERTNWSGPINYPVSCSPQAWAAGSIFQMLMACVNMHPDAINSTLRIIDPSLPDWLDRLTIRNLRIGEAELDIGFSNSGGNTFCQILRRVGNLRVIIET